MQFSGALAVCARHIVDLNGDGQPDVITANREGNNIRVLLHVE